jgi:hypothetical protein
MVRALPNSLLNTGNTLTATAPARYNPYIKDITALSNLKVLINQYESDELYDIWDHYRARLREQHPGILGLE